MQCTHTHTKGGLQTTAAASSPVPSSSEVWPGPLQQQQQKPQPQQQRGERMLTTALPAPPPPPAPLLLASHSPPPSICAGPFAPSKQTHTAMCCAYLVVQGVQRGTTQSAAPSSQAAHHPTGLTQRCVCVGWEAEAKAEAAGEVGAGWRS